MKFFRAIDSGLAKIEWSIVVFLVAIMILMAFLQVVLRNVFHTGVLWIDPFLRHLVLWLGFLGAMMATRQDRHIRIDILSRFLTPKLKRLSSTVTSLFSAVVCYLLFDASVTFVLVEKEFGGLLPLFTDVPIWYIQAIMPIGFAVMMVRFLLRSIDQTVAILRGLPPQEETP